MLIEDNDRDDCEPLIYKELRYIPGDSGMWSAFIELLKYLIEGKRI